MSKTYIHYGSKTFNPELIHGPHNKNWIKPEHALWASAEDAGYPWSKWCEENDYGSCEEDDCFRFRLKDNAKVFYIDSIEKAKAIPLEPSIYYCMKTYDFDKLKADGYDAVEINISACPDLYMEMYGWDCDSIAILKPDIVEVIF